ncbi:MAG: ABC transporter ATP-binding protein [Defluviitaleaceae bacterium]|nr:ABC transporter ATP-binding protein [Defluviitaleaceae bacterium]
MIQIKNLTKTFDGQKALDGLNLNVKKGSIYGLVGINGSGKTTALNHITGLYKQDFGECQVNGENSYDNKKMKETLGYIPDELFFFTNYNLKNTKAFYKNMYKNWNEDRYKDLIERLQLNEKKRLKGFSKGMQKQAAFALIMSTMPEVLILDEPIDGLDPIVKKVIMEYIIEDVADRGLTTVISSHNLKEMDGICDTVGIMKKGKTLIEGELDEIRQKISGESEPLSLDEIFVKVYENDYKNRGVEKNDK